MAKTVNRGDVLLTRFPWTDLKGTSIRPALVLSQGLIGQDVILAAISSVVRSFPVPTDYLLDTSHPEFGSTGLKLSSVIRLHKLVTVEESLLIRKLGTIGAQTQADVDQLLRQMLSL